MHPFALRVSLRTSVHLAVSAVVMLAATGVSASAQSAPAGQPAPGVPAATVRPNYPSTRRSDQVDTYFGTSVADPYRWLEDTDAPETTDWVQRENAVTNAYLASLPERDAIRARLTALWNYPKYTAPFERGGRYFYSENSGLQNQSVLYVTDRPTRPGRVLLDPNTLSRDGTVALSALSVSRNGRLLGYGTSASGSDWQEFHVREVDSGRDLADTLKWVKFSGMAWTKDNRGFFYSRYDAPTSGNALTNVNQNQKLYYHRLGTPQSSDLLVYERPDHPDWGFGARVTEDGQYAIISISQGTSPKNRLYFIDLDNPKKPSVTAPVVKLLDGFDASYDFIDNVGPTFYLRTDREAPRGRVIAIDAFTSRENQDWRTVIPEAKDALGDVSLIGDRFVASYLKDAHSDVRLFTLEGAAAGTLALPGLGSVGGIDGQRGDDEFFYTFTSYLTPPAVYRYDLKKRRSTLLREPKLDFDASRYETRQFFYTSKDGTRVPMFVTARKGVALDGTNPTLLYGYGGFNVSLTPSFSPATLVWLEMGGVYAVANLRGGGEYGQEWHEAGTLLRKQNVFDDFIAAAEYLVREKYTSPAKLAIQGGSNGGLLVGAAMTQRPDLFAVALPAVGVMDMLRFHKFTIGWAWKSDYGSSEDSSQFRALYAYSPLHNLKPGIRYPATLVTTADHDDRVVPGHSFKFAAALQQAQLRSGPPVLIRIESKAGHGAGKPTSKRIQEVADLWAFTAHHLDVQPLGAMPRAQPPVVP